MKTLTIDELKKAAAETWGELAFKRYESVEVSAGAPALAAVVRFDLKKDFVKALDSVKPEAQRVFSEWIGREAHFIENQTEDCLVFHSRDELRAYLNERHEAKAAQAKTEEATFSVNPTEAGEADAQ